MVFKVVREQDGRLLSALAEGLACVEYGPFWVEAPRFLKERGYGLLAFETLSAAREFASGASGLQIWEAMAWSVKRTLPPILRLNSLRKGKMKKEIFYDWPEGSVMCGALRLVRLVECS